MKPYICKYSEEVCAEGVRHAILKKATTTGIRYLHYPIVRYPPYALPVLLSKDGPQ